MRKDRRFARSMSAFENGSYILVSGKDCFQYMNGDCVAQFDISKLPSLVWWVEVFRNPRNVNGFHSITIEGWNVADTSHD